MPRITVTETVRAPLGRVFAAAADIPHAAEHIGAIQSIEVLTEAPEAADNHGPVGRGFVWKETRTMFGKQATETMTITEWSPPHAYTAEARSHGCHYRTTLAFHSTGPESTRITASFQGTPETFAAKVLSKLFAFMNKTIAKCLSADLRDLKNRLESGA
jgi:hypothetical protein